MVSNGFLFLEVTDSEALSMGWKEADLDTLKDHHPSFMFLVLHKTIQTIYSNVTDRFAISTKMVSISSRRSGVTLIQFGSKANAVELLTADFVHLLWEDLFDPPDWSNHTSHMRYFLMWLFSRQMKPRVNGEAHLLHSCMWPRDSS